MEVTTKQKLLAHLPAAFARQYDKQYEGIYGRLKAEGKALTEAKAAEIIGNDSWTRNLCDECGQDSEATIALGKSPYYDSSTASVCLPCLQKAVALVSSASSAPAVLATV